MEIKKIVDVHKENGTLEFYKNRKINMDFTKISDETLRLQPTILIRKLQLSCPFHVDIASFGVDPGTTHLGLAHIYNDIATIYEINMVRPVTIIDKMNAVYQLMDVCSGTFHANSKGIIEGASYGDKYRQVELAEIRTIAAFWFIKYGITPIIVPPTTIRKQVVGGGKIKPEKVWKYLPPNAANALACALYRP